MKIKVLWDEASTSKSASSTFTITITYEQDTEGRPTTMTKKENYEVGDEFCLGTECFYVIKDNGNTVTALAKYNLDLNNNLQSENSNGSIAFSQDNYWYGSGLKPEYGSSYPADVYDENSLLYEPVENYESYLKDTLGKTSVDARLITYDELESLGCSGASVSCKSAPSWVYYTTYWSASAYDNYDVWVVFSSGYFDYGDFGNYVDFVVRSVITINKSEI